MPSRSPVGFAQSRARKLRDAANRLRACRTAFGEVYIGTHEQLEQVKNADRVLTEAAKMLERYAHELDLT